MYKCDFCSKEFLKETTLMVHQCAKKQRWLIRENKNALLGFMNWQRYYQIAGVPKKNKKLEYLDFIESKFFNDFLSLGTFLVKGYSPSPEKYIDYLVEYKIPIKKWCVENTLSQYNKRVIFNELPSPAIERSIKWIEKYCEENNMDFNSFFEEVNTNVFVDVLRKGKLSPWILYIPKTSGNILNRLDESQYKLLGELISPAIWHVKIKKHKEEIEEIKQILSSVGL